MFGPYKKNYCVVIWIICCCKLVGIGGGGGYNEYLECQICSFVKQNWQVIEKWKYVECANNVTTFSVCGGILKADACEIHSFTNLVNFIFIG